MCALNLYNSCIDLVAAVLGSAYIPGSNPCISGCGVEFGLDIGKQDLFVPSLYQLRLKKRCYQCLELEAKSHRGDNHYQILWGPLKQKKKINNYLTTFHTPIFNTWVGMRIIKIEII